MFVTLPLTKLSAILLLYMNELPSESNGNLVTLLPMFVRGFRQKLESIVSYDFKLTEFLIFRKREALL